MRKRIICLLLSCVLVLGTVSAVLPKANAASSLHASEDCISLLKTMEGFIATPVWDVSQWSVGYGSAVTGTDVDKYKTTPITETEADTLLRDYVKKAEDKVNAFADTLGKTFQQKEFDALITFSYNCGTAWMTDSSGVLYQAIAAGKKDNDFLSAIASWCHSGSTLQTGLVERRLKEANVYVNGVYSNTVPSDFCYVILNSCSGECSVALKAFFKDSPITILPVATREGYKFLGWYTEPLSHGTKVDSLTSSLDKKSVFAGWEKLEGGSGAGTVTDVTTTACDKEVVVTAASTMLYKNSSTAAAPVMSAAKDTVLHIVASGKDASNAEWGKTDGGNWVLLSDTAPKTAAASGTSVEITVNYLNVRSGAGTGYEVTECLPKGTKLTVSNIKKDAKGDYWGSYADKKWVCLTYTSYKPETTSSTETTPETPSTGTKTVTVTASTLNVRSGAGTTSAVVSGLPKGSKVQITTIQKVGSDNWGLIPGKGWICLAYTDYSASSGSSGSSGSSSSTAGGNVTVTAGTLNVRKTAGTGSEIVGSLYKGNIVTIASVKKVGSDYWGEISGKGWICLGWTDYRPTGSESSSSTTESVKTDCVVTGTSLNIRKTPGSSGTVVDCLHKGDTVTVTETSSVGGIVWGKIGTNKWICLSYTNYFNGSSSSSSSTAEMTGTFPKTGYVTASLLNVRDKAGTDGKIVGSLSNMASVTITEEKTVSATKWGKISTGWICLSYVKITATTPSSAPETPETPETPGTPETPDPAALLGKYQITASYVNIRKAPGLNTTVVDSLIKWSEVTVTETKEADGYTWGKYAEGKWICLAYAKKIG